MAAVASDPSLTAVCSFARANVDRVKPLLKQLGISRIPAVVLLAPGGQVLDTLRANSQVVRDAILQHSAALAPALRTPLATTSPSEDHAAAHLAAAKAEFLNQYGVLYGYQGWLEQHYQQEVGGRLGPTRHYLDYTGSALYPSSLLQAVYSNLMTHTYGNPHSAAAAASGAQLGSAGSSADSAGPAAASAAVVEEAALAVLRHVNADPAQYQVVFTRSAAPKRRRAGSLPPLLPPAAPEPAAAGGAEAAHYHLLAYPAEDNFAGVIYPLHWINQVGRYPSGLGALVVRTELVPLLHKVYFGGGSVALATPEGCWHVAKCDPAAALTDGTPNFLGAAALSLAYDNWDSRGGMKAVQEHTQALTSWLDQHLPSLHHSNGSPLLLLYGHHGQGKQQQQQPASIADGSGHVQTVSTNDGFGQGSVYNFQVLDAHGRPISYSRIEREAEAAGISLRSGCVCNPGACYDALGLQADEVQMLAGQKEGCGDDLDFVTVMRPVPAGNGDSNDVPVAEGLVATQVPLGSVRASFGWASTFEDAYALVSFLRGYIT
eukprot:gene8766-8945_t